MKKKENLLPVSFEKRQETSSFHSFSVKKKPENIQETLRPLLHPFFFFFFPSDIMSIKI